MDFQEYGYFDSEIVGYDEEGFPMLDRAMNSEMFALFIAKLVSNGVLGAPADCLMVQADEGMSINVRPGFVIINGYFGYNPKPAHIILDSVPSQYRRITAIVARLNKVERKIELIYKNGKTALNPSPPEILQPQGEGDYYDLCLATIRIESNQTVITQSNITDTRYDSSVCGVVTQLIDHLDTSVFFAQFNDFYQEFVDKSNVSYKEFCDIVLEAYNDLINRMNQYNDELLQKGEELYVQYKKEIADWIETIKNTLTSVENGELLLKLNAILDDMRILTDKDVENIITGIYVDDDDDSSIFEIVSDDDIDEIINGTYIDDDGDSEDISITATEEKVTEIVNQTFKGGKV